MFYLQNKFRTWKCYLQFSFKLLCGSTRLHSQCKSQLWEIWDTCEVYAVKDDSKRVVLTLALCAVVYQVWQYEFKHLSAGCVNGEQKVWIDNPTNSKICILYTLIRCPYMEHTQVNHTWSIKLAFQYFKCKNKET